MSQSWKVSVAQVVRGVACAPARQPPCPCVAVVLDTCTDGVRTWQIRDTEMEEGRKVRCQVTWSEAHVSVIELEANIGGTLQVCG